MPMFSEDRGDEKKYCTAEGGPIPEPAARIACGRDPEALARGRIFAEEIEKGFVADFEKSEEAFLAGRADAWDRMAHVSTFFVKDGTVYVSARSGNLIDFNGILAIFYSSVIVILPLPSSVPSGASWS